MKTSLVITTINKLNKNLKLFSEKCRDKNWDFYLIGDKKTKITANKKNSFYFDIPKQKDTALSFAKICPENSYSRKNIGYLLSYLNGNEIIVETDDDNLPKINFFNKIKLNQRVERIKNSGWINIYDLFTSKKKHNVWPRGLPLDELLNKKIFLKKRKSYKKYLIQQGVSEINPDVDAIYRFTQKKINIKFKNYQVSLGDSLSPFNSQNTIWHTSLLPLMYLPVTCTMRCTDIWRSLITLQIMRANKLEILFFGTSMYQIRNKHDLYQDFKDEVPAYLLNKKIINILENIKFKKGKKNFLLNLKKSYDELIKYKIFDPKEKKYLNAWINDCKKLMNNR